MIRKLSQEEIIQAIPLIDVKKHANITDGNNDMLLQAYIDVYTEQASLKTNRILVESLWEWTIESIETVNKFPICPVSNMKIIDTDTDEEFTDYLVVYSSLEPLGSEIFGYFIPQSPLPVNYRIELTVGYPNIINTVYVDPEKAPILISEKINYTQNSIELIFDTEVFGTAIKDDFEIYSQGEVNTISSLVIDKKVLLTLEKPLIDGDFISISFSGGMIYDYFQNFVQPISDSFMVNFSQIGNIPEPTSFFDEKICNMPKLIKQWIIINVATAYQNRTNDIEKVYQNNRFVECLLDPYMTSAMWGAI